MRCLERDPARRFQRADDVERALRGEAPPEPALDGGAARGFFRRAIRRK